MTIVILSLIVGLLLISTGLCAIVLVNAPQGYEDENGFRFGQDVELHLIRNALPKAKEVSKLDEVA